MQEKNKMAQMGFSFPKTQNQDRQTLTPKNVVSFQEARMKADNVRSKSRENEVVNKIVRLSKTLNW